MGPSMVWPGSPRQRNFAHRTLLNSCNLHLGSQAITVKLSFSEVRQPFTKSGQELRLRVMCGRFTFSAISNASSTSIQRYLTVLSTLLILSGPETLFRKYQVNRAHLGQEGIALS